MHSPSLSEPSSLLFLAPAAWRCRRCLPARQAGACPSPVDETQKMAELPGLGDERGEGASGAPTLADCCLADNRLNLDVYPAGCRRLLQLFEGRRAEVVQVEFLRLSTNDRLLGAALGILPRLKHLKSLVLKGEFLHPSPRLGFWVCLLSTSQTASGAFLVLVPCAMAVALSLAPSCMEISSGITFQTPLSFLSPYGCMGNNFWVW